MKMNRSCRSKESSLYDSSAELGFAQVLLRLLFVLQAEYSLRYCPSFIDGLHVFSFRIRVIDYAGARVDVGDSILDQSGANGDCRIEIAAPVNKADSACIGPAALGFQLRQDLHSAHLGCTADGAAWETSTQCRQSCPIGFQRAENLGAQVHDVGVAQHLRHRTDIYGTGGTHLA